MCKCRYYRMCEDAYERWCDGEEYTCYNYEKMPNVDKLLELADDCEECMKFGKEHVSNNMAHDYYGNILRDVIDCIRKECEGYVKD